MRSREERERSEDVDFWRKYGLLLLWLLAVVAMLDAWRRDPYVPRPIGLPSYHHNGPWDLPWFLGLSVVEVGVVYLLLRPWSGRRSWWRPIGAVIALLALVPWTVLLAVVGMHSGPIFGLHTLWVMALDVVVLGTLVVSAAHRFIDWRADRKRAA
jgi:hypothetical protein